MNKASHREGGFTLTELIVSMVISTAILLAVFSLLQAGANGYKQVSSGLTETTNSRTAVELIQDDLDNIVLGLPISYGDGESDTGWNLVKGLYTLWDSSYSYGAYFPSESGNDFPCDRIGFFITISDEAAAAYNGKNIAHVLYFTAITKDVQNEDLSQDFSPTSMGYSRKLFRYFTPPDRVYERLNLITPTPSYGVSQGSAALPRGPNYTGSEVIEDDEGWTFPRDKPPVDVTLEPLSSAVLSLVANDVAQFKVSISSILKTLDGSLGNIVLEDFSSDYNTGDAIRAKFPDDTNNIPSDFHEVLESSTSLGTHHIIPSKIDFEIKVCPNTAARTLIASDWNTIVNGQYLGRENILPITVTFTKNLQQ